MEQDDDTIIIIVGDESNCKSSYFPFSENQEEILDHTDINPSIQDHTYANVNMNDLPLNERNENLNEEFLSEKFTKRYKRSCRYRGSLVKELREQHPEVAADTDLMISTLAEIMRSKIKPPPPPKNHYVMNGVMFECLECSNLFKRKFQVSRHYQEIHGPMYLNCFSCGFGFRRSSNLYAHEKRCKAPDRQTVLRARAISVGNKGRRRPFLDQAKELRQREYFPSERKSRSKRWHSKKRHKLSTVQKENMLSAVQKENILNSWLKKIKIQ